MLTLTSLYFQQIKIVKKHAKTIWHPVAVDYQTAWQWKCYF